MNPAQENRAPPAAQRLIAVLLILVFAVGAAVVVGWPLAIDLTFLIRAQPVARTGLFNQPASVFFSNFTIATTAIYAAYLLATCTIGHALIRLFRRSRDAAFDPLVFVIGFLPGYLLVLAANRLTSILFAHSIAPSFSLALVISAAFASLLLASRRRRSDMTTPRSPLTHYVVVIGMVVIVTILSLATGPSFVTGDGTDFFLSYFKSMLVDASFPSLHFPIFAQHYDEAMYLYPIIALFRWTHADGLIAYYWLLYGLFKSAIVLATYKSLRTFDVSPAFAALLTTFLFVGRHTLSSGHIMLFDSLNPLLYCSHPSRMLVGILPLLLLAFFARFRHDTGQLPLRALVVIAIGVGSSALPIHLITTALAAYAVVFVADFVHKEVGSARYIMRLRILLLLLPAVLLVSCFIAYHRPSVTSAYYLVALCVILALVFCAPLLGRLDGLAHHVRTHASQLMTVALFVVGFALGAALLGNLPVTRLRLYEHWSIPLLSTGKASSFSFGYNPFVDLEWGFVFYHLKGFASFTQAYGLPLLLSSISFAAVAGQWFGLRREAGTRMLMALGFFTMFLVANLIVFDFFSRANNWLDVWMKSRLIEPWFYSTIAAGVLLLYGEAKQRNWDRQLGAWLFIFGVAWVAFDPRVSLLRQLHYNLQYLLLR